MRGGRRPAPAYGHCPGCGELLSFIAVAAEDQVEAGTTRLREKLGIKARHPGEGKPHLIKTVGDDLQRSTGRWLHLERTVDRENDDYRETLTDPQTGEVLLDKRERLSEHRGRGAAKPKSPEPPSDT